jgi:hypothetical protein
MFAYIHKIDDLQYDNYGQLYFIKFSGFQFIEVIEIDHCVGFFKMENNPRYKFYILYREKI